MPRCAAVRPVVALLLAAATACTRRTVAPPPVAEPMARGGLAVETAAARDVVSAFIAEEARGEEGADTLLAPGADFIATGIIRTTRPRLAAMLGRGEGTIEEARSETSGGFAWVTVVYRWAGPTPDSADRARATFVLVRSLAGWQIRHVHSSAVGRWD